MRWIVAACIAIVAFDAITAVASRELAFDPSGLPGLVVSTAIYAFPAVMVVRKGGDLRAAALAGATVALADASIGWALFWAIGPADPPPDGDGVVLVLTALTVVGIGAVVGTLAGIVTRRLR